MLALSTAADERSPQYRPDIDGLRAIAITAVVLFHAGLAPFSSGFVGVDIFFVISGFLIGGIILDAVRARQFSFVSFYARRARRILPALFLVVAATLVIGSFFLTAYELSALGKSAAASIVGVSNIVFWKSVSYFTPDAKLDPLLMTWSLGVEEQFYVLFPLLMLAVAKHSRRTILITLAAVTALSFVLSVWATSHRLSAAFYLLPPRAWELGAGALLAALRSRDLGVSSWRLHGMPREALALAGALALAVSTMVFSEDTPFPGWAALLPVLGTVALIASDGSAFNRIVLAAPPMVLVGLVSYSWYLWHWPLMTFVRISSVVPPPTAALVVTAAISFAIAYLSWRFVERPFRTLRLAPGAVLLRSAVAIASVLLVCGVIEAGHGWPQRETKATEDIEKDGNQFFYYPCLASWGKTQPDETASCKTPLPGAPVVVLIGDSHAAALGPGLQALAARSGWRSEVLAKTSCRPLIGVTIWRRDHPQLPQECAAFMETAFRLAQDPAVKTVLLAGMWSPPLTNGPDEYYLPVGGGDSSDGLALLRTGLGNAIDALKRSGKDVVLIGDTPNWRFNPAMLEIAETIWPRHLVGTLATGRLHTSDAGPDDVAPPAPGVDPLLQTLASAQGVRLLDLRSRFCAADRCRFESGDTHFFVDSSHLSTAGAEHALEGFLLAPGVAAAPGRIGGALPAVPAAPPDPSHANEPSSKAALQRSKSIAVPARPNRPA